MGYQKCCPSRCVHQFPEQSEQKRSRSIFYKSRQNCGHRYTRHKMPGICQSHARNGYKCIQVPPCE
ncbi:Uncharacterised protein [Vibrio cholerae]|nr:Uncharacterised protein [Vibrio cholerae]